MQGIGGFLLFAPGKEVQAAYVTLTPNATLSIAGPYDTATVGAGNWTGGTGATYREFITVGQQYRIRQNGTISRIRIYTATKTNLTGFYVKIWRKNGTNYDLVGTSNNMISSLSAGSTNTIDLSTPIAGVQEGDYYGYRIEQSNTASAFYVRTSVSGVTSYYVTGSTPSETGYNWAGQSSVAGAVLPIEMYMTSPQVAFIGDSIIAGHPAHYSFLETTATTNIASTMESQFGILTGYAYQNMGIGSQTTTQIAARFTNDVVNLHPRAVVIDGGVNDIAGGSITKATFLANWTAMLDACQSNNIIPIVVPILPWTNGTVDQMNTRDDWNASLVTLVRSYPNAKVADMSSAVGQFRAGGSEGNLWDIKPAYNADGVHFNATGYGAIATELATSFPSYYLKITGTSTQTAGGTQTITLRAYDEANNIYSGYTGNKSITLSGATAIGAYTPTFTDKDGNTVNFGSTGTLNFSNGVATTTVRLYKAENVTMDASDLLYTTSGTPANELSVAVSAAAVNNFIITAPSSAISATPFSFSLLSKDLYGNTTTSVTNGTTLSINQGIINPTSVSAGQFQDDGSYASNVTVSGINQDASITLTVQNGSINQNVSISVRAAYRSLSADSTLSVAGPYDTAAAGVGNWSCTAACSAGGYREFITIGQQYRIRQNGTISRIKIYTASTTNLTGLYLKIWRKNGTNYDLVGTSDNLVGGLIAGGMANVNLALPISGVQEGDYYGYRIEGTANVNHFYARTAFTGVTSYYVNNATPSTTGYNWADQISAAGIVLPIEMYMASPQIAFIGDSIIAGHPAHYSFLETTATTNLASTIETQFGALTGYTYQDMGIGGQTTTQIAARFTNDVVNLHPRAVVIDGGVNDIALGGANTKTAFLNNWTAMLDACQNNNIIPIVIPIMPWTNGTTDQMNTRDDWNASLIALAQTYPSAMIVNMSSAVGQFRAGGPEGNLWDMKPAYNADGVHFNATGYGVIAQTLASALQQETNHFVITGSAAQSAGSTQTVTITAYDNFGDVYTDYIGDKTITLSGGTAIGVNTPAFTDKNGSNVNLGSSGMITFSSGAATTTLKLYKAETVELEAGDGVFDSNGNASYDLNITVAPASFSALSITSLSSITSESAFNLSLVSKDAYGNITTGVSDPAALSVDFGRIDTASLPANEFQDDGTYDGSITISEIYNDKNIVLTVRSGAVTQTKNLSVTGVSHGSFSPSKPNIASIQAAIQNGSSIDFNNIPLNITQIAISRTEDFKDVSWVPFDSNELKIIQSAKETLYVKFRTKEGGVSDAVIIASRGGGTGNVSNIFIILNEGDIVKTAYNPDVYIIKYKGGKQYKRLILSPSVFRSYRHLKWENIKIVSVQQLDQYTTSNLVQVAGDKNIYELFPDGDTGERKSLAISDYDVDSIYEINKTDRDSYILEN